MIKHFLVFLLLPLMACAPAQTGPTTYKGDASELRSLPPNFSAVDPFYFVQHIQQTLGTLPDRYTSDADKLRFYEIAKERLNSSQDTRAFFRLPGSNTVSTAFVRFCLTKYDANAQRLGFSFITNSGVLSHARAGLEELQLATRVDSRDTYEATNALGARGTVVRTTESHVSIGWQKGDGGPLRNRFISYEFAVPMASGEARENETNIKCLIVFEPLAPFILDYHETVTPKFPNLIDKTVNGIVLVGRIQTIALFNQRTGQMYGIFR